MRMACAAVALVISMSGNDIERALTLARAKDAERQQFHSRYLFNLNDAAVTQIEVVTEFRRLVLIAEDHVLRGDFMFTRGVRAGEQALAPTHGKLTLRAQIRFNPLNTFAALPDYAFAVGIPSGAVVAVDTHGTPQYSSPFKNRQGKTVSTLFGETIEADIASSDIGQTQRPVAVTLDGKEVARITVDFSRLE
jgi:hypothetical protein